MKKLMLIVSIFCISMMQPALAQDNDNDYNSDDDHGACHCVVTFTRMPWCYTGTRGWCDTLGRSGGLSSCYFVTDGDCN